jgi:hypothetical protein
MFIGIIAHTYINIYIYTMFLKKLYVALLYREWMHHMETCNM